MASRSVQASEALGALGRVREEMPIFPLPRVVLLPGGLLPLHVFEPRYRALVAHCLAGDRLLAVATLQPGYRAAYHGAPPVWPEVGIGTIVSHTPMDEGRSNIVVEQVARARILLETPSPHPFRLTRVEIRADDLTGSGPAVARLQALLLQIAAVRGSTPEEARRLVDHGGADLVDDLARRLLSHPDDQRRYLAMDRLADRAGWMAERLGTLVSPSGPAAEA